MTPFAKQQTLATFRQHQELAAELIYTDRTDYDTWKAQDRAEKLRKAKLRQIRKWRIKGTSQGVEHTVVVEAADHNDAVRAGSHHPHMLVVRDVVLLD